jgi:hypothetical protein
MSAKKMWTRQFHRWTSIVFTVTVIANFVAMSQGPPPAWVTYSPLLPLALLLFTGLYMFVLPYADKWASKWRERRMVDRSERDGGQEA